MVRPDKHSMLAMRMFWNLDGVERENGLDTSDTVACSSRCVFLVHPTGPTIESRNVDNLMHLGTKS